MGLRNHELLAICEALNLTPPPRATVADLEMMLKHWYNSRGNSQLVPYTGAVAVAPAWVMAHRAAAITPLQPAARLWARVVRRRPPPVRTPRPCLWPSRSP